MLRFLITNIPNIDRSKATKFDSKFSMFVNLFIIFKGIVQQQKFLQ